MRVGIDFKAGRITLELPMDGGLTTTATLNSTAAKALRDGLTANIPVLEAYEEQKAARHYREEIIHGQNKSGRPDEGLRENLETLTPP